MSQLFHCYYKRDKFEQGQEDDQGIQNYSDESAAMALLNLNYTTQK